MMRKSLFYLAVSTLCFASGLHAGETRNIEVISDNDADTIVSKIFKLKHAKAQNILPHVRHAVYSAIGAANEGTTGVSLFNYGMDDEDAILVTVKESDLPDIEDMIQKIDKPGLDGSGFFNFEYEFKYRSDIHFWTDVLNKFVTEARSTTITGEKLIFKGDKGWGTHTLKWIERLDKLVPRYELTFTTYEVAEDDIKDLGVDYTSWLADVHAGGIVPFKFGGMFTTARGMDSDWTYIEQNEFQFNGSYIRMLQQKGIANIATTGSIMVKNNMSPLSKTSDYTAELNLVASNSSDTGTAASTDITEINIKCEPELFYRGNFCELRWAIIASNNSNEHTMVSQVKLADNEEKLLFAYNRQHDVTQYNGMPFLGNIPVLKYLVGDEITSQVNTKVFITVTAKPIKDSNISQRDTDVISKSTIKQKSEEN